MQLVEKGTNWEFVYNLDFTWIAQFSGFTNFGPCISLTLASYKFSEVLSWERRFWLFLKVLERISLDIDRYPDSTVYADM